MNNKSFDYEDVFMGVRDQKPSSYVRRFRDDYRLFSLVKTVKIKKGKLLDIGCGGGMLTESLPYYYPKTDIYGCDVSATAIKYAKKFGSGKIEYGVINKKTLPYKDNTFDICICLDVLEHVPDVNFFLKEVKRVLKKNGQFFLIVPCEGQPFTYTWLFQKIQIGQTLTYRFFGHIHPEFTHQYVIALLKKHGFSIKNVAYSEHIFYQLMHLFVYFLPKALLEFFLGEEKTKEYANSSLIESPKSSNNPLIIIRKFWFTFFDFMMMYPMYWETVILSRMPMSAWKLHVLVIKNINE